MKEYNFTIVIHKNDIDEYLAACPALPGCYSGGQSLEEAIFMIRENIEIHIQDLINDGEFIPEEVYSGKISVIV